MKSILLIPTAVVLVSLVGVYGCNSSETNTPDASPAAATPHDHTDDDYTDDDHAGDGHDEHGHGDHDHAEASDSAGETDMEKMTETLASFSEEDRASAMKQHFCPVSGEMLGAMGKPEKVDVKGEAVWICCDGCKDKLLADPDKYLAKIRK